MLAHGNNGQTLFHDDADYQRYLELLAGYARRHGLNIFHFILMPKHIHLILEAPIGESLSEAMRGLSLAYGWTYRKRHRYSGHLWQGRFKSLLIDRDRELLGHGRQVEMDAVHAGLVTEPGQYPWSSYQTYAQGTALSFLARHPEYEALGACARERQERYRQLVQRMPQRPQHASSRYGFPVSARGRGRPKLEGITGETT